MLLTLFLNSFAFYGFNQRNHSEINWQQIETANTIIVYSDSLEADAQKAAQIAQATYNALVKSYKIELKDKVRIYLSDMDQITNGGSVMEKYIIIWSGSNDYINHFTGRDKWLRKVISHEMSHHFVAQSIHGWADNFFPFSSFEFPSDMNEGYAMFFSGEEWGYGRSDAALRKAVYSNNLDYKIGDGFFYAAGFSMVRYLQTKYGEDKLAELLKYRSDFKLYDFKAAFKSVYKKDFTEFKEEWRKDIYTYYFGSAYNIKNPADSLNNSAFTLNAAKQLKFDWNSVNLVNIKNNSALVFGKKYKNQQYLDISLINGINDSLQVNKLHFDKVANIAKSSYSDHSTGLNSALSENGLFAAYTKTDRYRHGGIFSTIYLYDAKKSITTRTVQGNLPQITNDGTVFYQSADKKGNYIKKIDQSGRVSTILTFAVDCQIGKFVLSPDEKHLIISRFDENSRFFTDLHDLSTNKTASSKEWNFVPRQIGFKSNDQIFVLIESDLDFRTVLWTSPITAANWQQYKTPPFNLAGILQFMPVDSTGKESVMVFSDLSREKREIGLVQISLATNFAATQPETAPSFYNSWMKTRYNNPIVVSSENPVIGTVKNYNSFSNIDKFAIVPLPTEKFLTLAGIFADPLAKHFFQGGIYLPYEFKAEDIWASATYQNNCFYPSLSFSYLQGQWFAGSDNGDFSYQKVKNAGVALSFPVDFLPSSFWNFNYGFGGNYLDVKSVEDDSTAIFEDGDLFTMSAFTGFGYKLPYLNSEYHPVREISASYQLTGATEKLKMQKDFTSHIFDLKLAYTPLFDLAKNENLKTINLQSKLRYEQLNGRYLAQFQPGIDSYKNIPVKDIISSRRYLRGYEETMLGDQLFSAQNEIWLKVADNFNFSVNLGFPLIQFGYLGIAGFADYAKISFENQSKEYKSYGWEVKTVCEILGIPTVHRYGQAFDFDNKKLGYYYQAEIPMFGK